MYIAYWRDRERNTRHGYVKARTPDEAYDFIVKKLQKGCVVTAVYRTNPYEITPQDICLNFHNTAEYRLF